MVAALSLAGQPLGLSVGGQSLTFLLSVVLGAGLGALYDLFRISRKAFALPAILIAIEDLLYFFLCAFATFCYMLGATDGRVRWFILLGELLGAVIYHFTLGELVMAVSDAILRAARAVLSFVWRLTGAPLLRVLGYLSGIGIRFGVKAKVYLKKSARRHKNSLKRQGKVLYNSSMAALSRKKPRRRGERGEN